MYKKLLSETVIYGIGAIFPRLIMFVLTPLYTGHISTGDFSIFSQLYAAVSFVNILLTFGFETTFFRYAAEKSTVKTVLNTSFWFIFLNATSFLILTYLFNIPLAKFFDYEEYPHFLLWFAWIAFFDAICVIPFALLRFNNRPILYSAIKVGQVLFQFSLTMFFFLYLSEETMRSIGLENKLSCIFYINILSSLIAIPLLFSVFKQIRFQFDFSLFKVMISYSYPIVLAGFAFVVNENMDKLIMRNMVSPEEAGAYGGCYKLGALMTLFVTAYRMGVEPFFFKTAQQKDNKKIYANVLLYFTIICGAILVGLIGNLAWLKVVFIHNTDFYIAMDIVPIIIVANLFFGVYYNLSTWYKITDKTYVGTIISWIGASITILLNLIFIPILGFKAAAWATLFAYGTMMIISYIWGQKAYKIPYKTRKIVLYMALAIVFGILNYFLLNGNIIIGNILLLVYIAIAFFLEKKSFELEIKSK